MKSQTIVAMLVCSALAGAQNPLPLQLGNIWQYTSSDPMHPDRFRTEVIGDTVLPNARRYFVLTGSIFTSSFLRADSSRVYAPTGSMEYRVFDFDAMPGDTIAVLDGGMRTIMLRSAWFDSTAQRNMWYFVLYQGSPPFWYEFIEWWIQESIGVTRLRVEPGLSWWLSGARIDGDTIGVLTSVKDINLEIPERPDLSQNFPNPFNPKTSFRFEVSSFELVTLKVYDVLGREVATLVNETKEPGTYEVEWDATGQASGVYFYRLQSGTFADTRKLLLLR